MPTAKNKNLDKVLEKEIFADLLRYFKRIDSREDLDLFFNKLITPTEKIMIFRRLTAMKLIKQGKKYRQIRKMYDISNDVISKASETLKGKGYKKNPNRKKKYSSLGSDKKRFKPFTRKYKGAESIVNIFDYL